MTDRNRVFRAAGYVFVQRETSGPERAPALEMYREGAVGGGRHFVTRAPCGPGPDAAYARALAMVAWVRSLDVPVRRDPQAQAVLEQVAILNDRMGRIQEKAAPVRATSVRAAERRYAAA